MAAVASALWAHGAGLADPPRLAPARKTAGHRHDGRELADLMVVAAPACALATRGLLHRRGRLDVAPALAISLFGLLRAMDFLRETKHS